MKPSHEKVKTRPYLSKGLSTGIDSAFRLLGLMPGDVNSRFTNPIAFMSCYESYVYGVTKGRRVLGRFNI